MNKILIIANIRKTQGGITTQIAELENSLKENDIVTYVISTHGNIVERINGIYTSYLKAKNCDMILGVGCAYLGFLPIVVAYMVSVLRLKPVCYNFHDGQVKEFLKKYFGLVKLVFKNKQIIVATKFLHNVFKSYGFNVITIPNHFNNININESVSVESQSLKVIWARSFERLYRVDLAIDTAKYFYGKKNIEFHFYGGGADYYYYSNIYRGGNIFFHGVLKRADLLKEYKKYNIFLNTSEYDNFPMSIVEAGLNNLLVISSKVGGIESIYSDNEILYFESGNLANLINVFDEITNTNDNKYKSISANLTKKVKSFNWENVKEMWFQALNIKMK